MNPSDVKNFPVFAGLLFDEKLSALGKEYDHELHATSSMLTRMQQSTGRTETQSFKISKLKPLIDNIDHRLGELYGLSRESLDFITSYDAKYRLGQGGADRDD